MIAINLPSFKKDNLNYISVEIFNTEEEKPPRPELKKPDNPVTKPLKREVLPSLPIAKPETLPVKKPEILPVKKPEILPVKTVETVPIEKPEINNKDLLKTSPPDLPPKKPEIKKDIFDDMLKNLAEEEPVSKTQNREELKDLKNENQDQLHLSPIFIRKIVEQIYFHWMRPPGLKKSDDMSVQIRIHLRTDGTIKKIIRSKQVLKKLNNRTYLVYLEAAERALRRLEKFDGLPTNKYSTWKTIELNFKPY